MSWIHLILHRRIYCVPSSPLELWDWMTDKFCKINHGRTEKFSVIIVLPQYRHCIKDGKQYAKMACVSFHSVIILYILFFFYDAG